MNHNPPSHLITACLTVAMLITLSGCDMASMTQTINFGQGNIVSISGDKTTAILEGVTLEILHPGVDDISAKTFTVSSVPPGPEIQVYEIKLGTQLIQLSGTNNALSLTINEKSHGPIRSGSMIKIDQDGTVKVIMTDSGDVKPVKSP